MTGIVDYSAGNIRSVERALRSLGAPLVLSRSPRELADCDRIIFPGVGDASYAMRQLRLTGFDSFLRDWAAAGKKLLGICLGSQIIFEYSEEGDTDCLGLLPGTVRSIAALWRERGENQDGALKIPHMGWNDIRCTNGGSALLEGVPERSDFYFVHSYMICPADGAIVKAEADYGIPVPACVEKGSVTAFQFHPEKSGEQGMRILRNFCLGGTEGASC